MSIVGDILQELWDKELNYKGVRVNIFGIPRFKSFKKGTLGITVNRLKEKGLIEKELDGIILSRYGREYVRKKFDSLKKFDRPETINKDRNLVIMFDIPTERKSEREWLRWHLKKFGFIMIQQSVWVGPSPLATQFSEYIKSIKLDKCIKIFKLEKPYK